MLTESDIREALRACYDASHVYRKPVNIVDLGLIEAIALTLDPDAPGANIPGVPPRQQLALTLLAPSADEDAQTQLRAQILNRLAGLPELWRSEVHFAAEPWTPGRISPEGRRLLELDFPILNNRAPR
jgi:metal-sulfur cluster biosynthetic enzyme